MKLKHKEYTTRIPVDYLLPEERIPGERKVILGHVIIDRSVFKKSEKEKLLLKIAKSQIKDSNKKLK